MLNNFSSLLTPTPLYDRSGMDPMIVAGTSGAVSLFLGFFVGQALTQSVWRLFNKKTAREMTLVSVNNWLSLFLFFVSPQQRAGFYSNTYTHTHTCLHQTQILRSASKISTDAL